MLWKLLKHEFKAMGRIMLPVWAALLVLAVFVNLADRLFLHGDSLYAEIFTAMLVMLFVFGCMAAAVVAVIMMVLRFQKTMLSREGYLTHTLPVNVHQLVWSRMLTALAYIVLTSLVIVVSFFISIAQTGVVKEMLNVFTALWQDLMGYSVLHGVLYVVEFVLMIVLAGLSSCLMFYAALSIGHSFADHKMLLSVVFYFVLYVASQVVTLLGTVILGNATFNQFLVMDTMAAEHTFRMTHMILGGFLLLYLVYAAVYYLLTTGMLKRRLNLQ